MFRLSLVILFVATFFFPSFCDAEMAPVDFKKKLKEHKYIDPSVWQQALEDYKNELEESDWEQEFEDFKDELEEDFGMDDGGDFKNLLDYLDWLKEQERLLDDLLKNGPIY